MWIVGWLHHLKSPGCGARSRRIERPRSGFYRLAASPLFLVLLTPLVVHPGLYFPFVTAKIFYFRALVEISFAVYLIIVFRTGKIGLRPTVVMTVAGLFACTQLLTGALGADPSRSFWGGIERGEGLLTHLHLLAFCFLLVSLLRHLGNRRMLSAVWLVVGSVVVGIAFLESIRSEGILRPGSTLGSPTFLAGYLLLSIFMAVWMFASSRAVAVRAVSLFLAACFVAGLLLTATRSAVAGSVVGAAIILTLLWWAQPLRSRYRLAGVALVLLACCLTGIFVFGFLPLTDLEIVRRLSSISLNSGTVKFRWVTWNAAIPAFLDRPWLGFGPENFDVGFNAHFPPELSTLSPRETWVDRAHNSLIETAVTSGALGLIAYLGFYGVILMRLSRQWLESRSTPALILLGAFLAHFVDSLFSVSSLTTQMGFWFLVALVAEGEGQSAPHLPAEEPAVLVRSPNITFAAVVFLLLGIGLWQFNLRPMQACRELSEGGVAARSRSHDRAMLHFSRAIEKGSSYTADARRVMAEAVLGWLEGGPGSPGVEKAHVDRAIRELERVLRDHPLSLKSWILLTMLYNRSAAYSPENVDLALTSAEEALRLSPTRPGTYFEKGQAYLFKKDFTAALSAFEKALNLAPYSLEARWNQAVALVVAGRDREAESELRKLTEDGFDFSRVDNLRRLLAAYRAAGNQEKTRGLLEQLATLEPKNSLWSELLKESEAGR